MIAVLDAGWASANRHVRLDRGSWFRAIVGRLRGTVTGYIVLGTTVVTYEVQLDDGARRYVVPAEIAAAPNPTGRPALTCIRGGRP